jgi:hypothetical protein
MGVFQVIPEDNLVLFDEHGEMSQQEHGRGKVKCIVEDLRVWSDG